MSATAHLPQIAKIASTPNTVAYETITATPSSPHIGAEIGNIDLRRPLSNKQVTELQDAFARYQVIFFRELKSRSAAVSCRILWRAILWSGWRLGGNVTGWSR